MSHDPLEHLLRNADASAPALPLAADLPTRVRDRWKRRRRHRAITLVAILAVPLLATAVFRADPTPQVALERVAPPARHELARLELEADLHEETASRLLAAAGAAERDRHARVAEEPSVLAAVKEQRDRAALVLIYEADRAAREKQPQRALAAYRRTIELFPQTYWADVARRRLKEMTT